MSTSFEVLGGYVNVGLAYDKVTNYLWIGEYNPSGNGYIHETKRDGTEIRKIEVQGTENLQGVAYDSASDTIWVTDGNITTYNLFEVSKQGVILTSLQLPYKLGAGIAFNPDRNTLFVSPYSPDRTIYEINKSGTTITTITIDSAFNPSSGLLYADGMSYDMDTTLWITQNGDPSIWQINQSGSVLKSLANPSGNEAEGVALDLLDNTLWYSADEEYHQSVDDGNRIFHLDKSGNLVDGYTSNETIRPCKMIVNYGNEIRVCASFTNNGGVITENTPYINYE